MGATASVVLASDYDKSTQLVQELTNQLNRLKVEHEGMTTEKNMWRDALALVLKNAGVTGEDWHTHVVAPLLKSLKETHGIDFDTKTPPAAF